MRAAASPSTRWRRGGGTKRPPRRATPWRCATLAKCARTGVAPRAISRRRKPGTKRPPRPGARRRPGISLDCDRLWRRKIKRHQRIPARLLTRACDQPLIGPKVSFARAHHDLCFLHPHCADNSTLVMLGDCHIRQLNSEDILDHREGPGKRKNNQNAAMSSAFRTREAARAMRYDRIDIKLPSFGPAAGVDVSAYE